MNKVPLFEIWSHTWRCWNQTLVKQIKNAGKVVGVRKTCFWSDKNCLQAVTSSSPLSSDWTRLAFKTDGAWWLSSSYKLIVIFTGSNFSFIDVAISWNLNLISSFVYSARFFNKVAKSGISQWGSVSNIILGSLRGLEFLDIEFGSCSPTQVGISESISIKFFHTVRFEIKDDKVVTLEFIHRDVSIKDSQFIRKSTSQVIDSLWIENFIQLLTMMYMSL